MLAYWAGLSEEARDQKRMAKRGRVVSADTRARISAALKGQPRKVSHLHTPEVRAKIGASNRGRKVSAETRRKLSLSHLGQRRQLTSEHRAALSTAHRGKRLTPEHRAALSRAHYGKPRNLTDEQRSQISAQFRMAAVKRWSSASTEDRRCNSRRLNKACLAARQTRTSLERAVAAVLDALNIGYVSQYQIGPYVADFFIPDRRLVVEADGAYWHSLEHVVSRDAKRDTEMALLGYRVVRLPEARIRIGDFAVLLAAVA